ncbi:MAG: LysR family transcriptional regulator [Alphaproteobacteria bacterium]|nr:LysR family transcriptional regulator [Alphaproteobacteria bacterium]
MQLRDLQYYVALNECLCFRQTAFEFKIAQSTVSRAIARLETTLGGQLFSREGRKVRPSSFGRSMEPALYALRSQYEHIQNQADILLRTEGGHLRIGIDDNVVFSLLHPLLQKFSTTLPSAELEFVHASGPELHTALQEAEVDAVFLASPMTIADNFKSKSILRESYVIAVPQVLGAEETLAFPKKLEKLPLMVNENAIDSLLLEQALSQFEVQPKSIRKCQRMEWLVDLVSSGFGCGLVPQALAKKLDLKVSWDFAASLPPYELSFITARGRAFSPALKALDHEVTVFSKSSEMQLKIANG